MKMIQLQITFMIIFSPLNESRPVGCIFLVITTILLSVGATGTEEFKTGYNSRGDSVSFEYTITKHKDYALIDNKTHKGNDKIVLKENIVNGINLLTQAMFKHQSAIYAISSDFDLNQGRVVLPSDCILQFEGGSIRNGTLIGQDTEIQAGLLKIFDTNVTLAGSWKNNGHIRWFGAKPNNNDNTTTIQKCLDCFEVVELDNATYKTDALNMTKCRILKGIKAPRGKMSTFAFIFGSKVKTGLTVIYNNDYPYVEIEGVSFVLSDSKKTLKVLSLST